MPFSIGWMNFFLSATERFSFWNQSVRAKQPPGFRNFAAEAKNFRGS
jgi:hypothetical protein